MCGGMGQSQLAGWACTYKAAAAAARRGRSSGVRAGARGSCLVWCAVGLEAGGRAERRRGHRRSGIQRQAAPLHRSHSPLDARTSSAPAPNASVVCSCYGGGLASWGLRAVARWGVHQRMGMGTGSIINPKKAKHHVPTHPPKQRPSPRPRHKNDTTMLCLLLFAVVCGGLEANGKCSPMHPCDAIRKKASSLLRVGEGPTTEKRCS